MRWTLAASLLLHGIVLGVLLTLVQAAPPRPVASLPTRMLAVSPDLREDLGEVPELPEPLREAPLALPLAPPLPHLTPEPEPEPEPEAAALEVEPLPARELAPTPATLIDLPGRRVRAAPPAQATPPLPPPAAAPSAPAPLAGPPAPLRALSHPDPTYPAGLRWQGEVTLRLLLLVQADGRIGQVVVERSTGVAALDAHVAAYLARHWRFAPLSAPRWVGQVFHVPAPL